MTASSVTSASAPCGLDRGHGYGEQFIGLAKKIS
jgi:hypothetical protein